MEKLTNSREKKIRFGVGSISVADFLSNKVAAYSPRPLCSFAINFSLILACKSPYAARRIAIVLPVSAYITTREHSKDSHPKSSFFF